MIIKRHIGLPENEMGIIESEDMLIHNIVTSELKEKDRIITQLTNQLKEFKEKHKIMKQILIENGLWERLLNDDRFLKYLRDDDND